MSEAEILGLIQEDEWMMRVLKVARNLQLPDWMIGAGFVRAKVWDHLHGYSINTPVEDIDLIYFDSTNLDEAQEKEYEKILKNKISENWSVKNQARMHLKKNDTPYKNSTDALAHWVESPTCVAVILDEDNRLHLVAPHGIDDLTSMIVRPSPGFAGGLDAYRQRVRSKNWQAKWPKLTILDIN